MITFEEQLNRSMLIIFCFFFRQTDTSGDGRSVIKALRVFRVLRPFKGVHKIKKLQVCAVLKPDRVAT